MSLAELVLLILKFAGIAGTAASGFFGFFGKSTTPSGHFTKNGRRAFIALLLSPLIAASAQVAEVIKDQQKEQTEIHRVLRIMTAIKDVSISFWLSIPLSNPHLDLAGYRERLDKDVEAFVSACTEVEGVCVQPSLETLVKVDGKPSVIGIHAESALLSNSETESFAASLFSFHGIAISFYKDPAPSQDYRPYSFDNADLTFLAQCRGDELIMLGRHCQGGNGELQVAYLLDKKQLWLTADSLPSNSNEWISNGRILALPDLRGVRMIVHLLPAPALALTGPRGIAAAQAHHEIPSVIIAMAGHTFAFEGNALERQIDAEYGPYYVYTFPKREEDFPLLQRKLKLDSQVFCS
jgi:hypothetical protein